MDTEPIQVNGENVYVKRLHDILTTRIIQTIKIVWKVSEYFIISPDNVCSDGNDSDGKNVGEKTMKWATANGYLATAKWKSVPLSLVLSNSL